MMKTAFEGRKCNCVAVIVARMLFLSESLFDKPSVKKPKGHLKSEACSTSGVLDNSQLGPTKHGGANQ